MPIKKAAMMTKDILFFCILHLCAFFVVIMNGGIWAHNRTYDLTFWEEYDTLLTILFVTVSVLLIFSVKTIKFTKSWAHIAFVLMCSVLYLVNSDDGYNKTLYKQYFFIPLVLFIILFGLIKNKELFWRAFSNIVCTLSVVSLFFYIFGTWLRLISPTQHIIRGWGSWGPNPIPNFYYVYYQSQATHPGDFTLWRNCSIFAEAPMFNMVLCMALAAEVFLFRRKKGRRFVVALLIITIITTFSTTGYLFLALLGVLFLLNSSRFMSFCKNHRKIFFATLALFVGVCALMITIKLHSRTGSVSTSIRVDHTLTCLQIWKDNFLFGDGWLKDDNFLQLAQFAFGISVGFPYFLKCGGIMLGSLVLVPYVVSVIFAFKNKDLKIFSFNTLFMMLFVFTAVVRFPIVVTFIAYNVFACSSSIATDSSTAWVSKVGQAREFQKE
ncbi:hypothetical protein SAMN05216413_2524 [Ruminococcaceae bacterium KH2T8]|nr:hypothetical protein SAMN05216413_2524 [Ruminococcaceae bacterium KH2T8]